MGTSRRVVVVLGTAFEAGLAGLAWGVGWCTGASPLARFSPDPGDAGRGLAAAFPMTAAFLLLWFLPGRPFRSVRQALEEPLRILFTGCRLPELALLSAAAGLGEEVLFRGLLQEVLVGRLGFPAGLGITSLLFGLVHPLSISYVVVSACFGAYLGWLYSATGNLLVPMVAHGVYDFLILAYLVRFAQVGPGRRPGPDGDPGAVESDTSPSGSP